MACVLPKLKKNNCMGINHHGLSTWHCCKVLRGWMSPYLRQDSGLRMGGIARKADEIKLAPDAMEKFEYFANWEKGWKSGLDEYEEMWRKWEGP